MRILCVDDEEFIRDSLYLRGLKRKLKADELVIVASGEEAMAEVDRRHFDMVITDLKMPGASGLDVLKHVKGSDLGTQVLIVTGAASVETAVDAIRLGARDYIEKPVSIELLIEKVENIRDYQARLHEAEEFRLAKERCEAETSQEMHLLELRVQELEKGVDQVLAQVHRLRAQLPAGEYENLIALLKPLSWSEKN